MGHGYTYFEGFPGKMYFRRLKKQEEVIEDIWLRVLVLINGQYASRDLDYCALTSTNCGQCQDGWDSQVQTTTDGICKMPPNMARKNNNTHSHHQWLVLPVFTLMHYGSPNGKNAWRFPQKILIEILIFTAALIQTLILRLHHQCYQINENLMQLNQATSYAQVIDNILSGNLR